uniref:EFHB C-terminal EF-hand domain-containing protein n=1 Tax=Strombidium rassoulzadegani TaxID=1082188 RepID=A0A7S3FSN4_9SPIT|mmetsp:Transcript_11808/g.19950  ORF Transcript_11808/g.19950 Transcript_11808/m.19950 type:complete len:256 (+) Transcript_11808:571-1338(+)
MYRKTHGNFAPGEQKKRDYEWKFEPNDHVFGYAEKKVLNGAAMALQSERLEEQYPKTTIVMKTVEDHKAVTSDLLSKSKNLGQGQTERGPNFVHGVKNIQGKDPWNAGRCIHGEPNTQDVKADKDLGFSIKPNCRNVVRNEGDINRSFGIPTIRKDIPNKDFRSVADYQNYGDEPEAVDLLFPSNYSEIGIQETDFRSPRTREEIRLLFEKVGYSYKIGKFNAMYNRAKEIAGSEDDRVSVRHFQIVISEMHSLE